VGVVDAGDEILGQSSLTGEIEADVSSKGTVGEPGVAHPHRLFELLLEDAVAPERAVQLAKGFAQRRSIGEHRPSRLAHLPIVGRRTGNVAGAADADLVAVWFDPTDVARIDRSLPRRARLSGWLSH
jgi:hypothetical protein